MMRNGYNDISIHVAYLDLNLAIVAQGASWSPDVADDMIERMGKLMDKSFMAMYQYDLLPSELEEEYSDEDVTTLVETFKALVEDEEDG